MSEPVGTLLIAKVEFNYWLEDHFLHLKAGGFVHEELIGDEGVQIMQQLMEALRVTKLLLNFDKGYLSEIMDLDDRPNQYYELGVPLNFKVAGFTREQSGDVTYFDKVLRDSQYGMRLFTDLKVAKKWLVEN